MLGRFRQTVELQNSTRQTTYERVKIVLITWAQRPKTPPPQRSRGTQTLKLIQYKQGGSLTCGTRAIHGKQSERFGNRDFSPKICKMLVSPSRNPVRDQLYEYYKISIKAH